MTSSNRPAYSWYNEDSRTFMERGYLAPGQTVQQRVRQIGEYAQQVLLRTCRPEHLIDYLNFADRFEANMAKGWYSLSTPIWCNFGLDRGLGISCFGSYIGDTMESILTAQAEIGMLSKNGGGTSGKFYLRGRGADIKGNGKASGAPHMARLFQEQTRVISQGSARRGHFAGWLDIDHSDIMEWLDIQSEGNPLQDISFGVCVPSAWFLQMIAGDEAKRLVWAKLMQVRRNIGYPYIMFTDNVNLHTVDVYKALGLKIHHSNMCTEIALPNSELETFVCDLSSMNMLYVEEWEKTDAVEVLVTLLDVVMTDFIDRARDIKFMERTVRFAERHRALGLGQLGWHSYLQSKMIAFESMEAKMLNVRYAKALKLQAYAASMKLATHFGEPEILIGYGRRNTTLLAIAPTTSSAFILQQVSPSTELLDSNYFIKDVAKIKFTYKNPFLEQLLQHKGCNTPDVWLSILKRSGSVQHLECLSAHEKNVFKTFAETSQKEIIIQAAQRQKYIDQGQSLNLKIHPDVPTKDVNALYIFAHEQGIKTLYYQHSVNAAQEFTRNILHCESCE